MGAAQLADAKGLDLDIMIQTVEKTIVERIKELQKLNRDGKITLSTFNNKMKKARRALGTIVTNNPDILESDLVKLFGEGDLTPERVTNHFRNYTDRITGLYKSLGREGHHSQGIGTLRDYLVDMGYDIRKQYKNIVKLRGFKIGDQYMSYLDTGAHRSMTRGIEGILQQRGYNIADLPPGLIRAIEARMAHAKHFGGQGAKINVPSSIVRTLSKAGKVDTLADISTGVLALNKAGTQSGIMLDQIFGNPELVDDLDALYAAVRKTPIIDTSGIRRGIEEIDRNIRLYGPNIPEHLFKGTVNDILQQSAKITTQVGEAVDQIPGSKFVKKRGLSLYGLATDIGQALASPTKLKKDGTEEEIGTTDFMRNRYTTSADAMRKVGGFFGALSVPPDLKKLSHGRKAPIPGLKRLPGGGLRQQGLLAGTSILSYLAADRADHLSKTYKSDLDKFTTSLLPSTDQDDPELNERFESNVNQGVYSHSADNPVEIKQREKSLTEMYKNWIYGIN